MFQIHLKFNLILYPAFRQRLLLCFNRFNLNKCKTSLHNKIVYNVLCMYGSIAYFYVFGAWSSYKKWTNDFLAKYGVNTIPLL
jgi:hypothetical protein